MNRNFLTLCGFMTATFSQAMLSADEFASFQVAFSESDAYMTQVGDIVSILIPINRLFEGSTTYLTENANTITEPLEALIRQSDGKVYLKGVLNQDNENIVFATSALYAQVSNLSDYLLSSTPDISYSPVTVSAYYKNKNYGLWKIYPQEETFVNVDLVID